MSQFPIHSVATAPEKSKAQLQGVEKGLGFVPNLYGTFAESPALLQGYLALSEAFAKSSLTPTEQQIVLLATSRVNECEYCMAAHTVVAKMSKVADDVVVAVRDGEPLANAKLEALRAFTAAVVGKLGHPGEDEVKAFFAAGYSHQNLLEVLLGVGIKTLSNYTNHIAGTPLDEAFQPAAWAKAA